MVISQNNGYINDVITTYNNFECTLISDDEETYIGIPIPTIIQDDMRDYITDYINKIG